MEVTVRTLNSAKLKWKLSRMILFRVHAQRGNLSEILSGIFLARPRPTNSHQKRGPEYHYFTAASLYRSSLLDFAATTYPFSTHSRKMVSYSTKSQSRAFISDSTRIEKPIPADRRTVKYLRQKGINVLNIYRTESRPPQFPKIFREIARKRGNAEPRRIRSSAEESSPVDLAYNISCRLLFLLCRSIDRAGASTRAPRRVRRLGYTRVTGKANARERAKKAWERRGWEGKAVCSSKGKPVRRTNGTSSRGNPAYLLRGTGKHVEDEGSLASISRKARRSEAR